MTGTPTAEAALPWAAPQIVSSPGDEPVSDVGIGFGAAGRGLVSWNVDSNRARPGLGDGNTALRFIAGGGIPGARLSLARPLVGRPVFFGRDRYALLRRTTLCPRNYAECGNGGPNTRARLTVAFGRPGPAPDAVQQLDRILNAGDAMLAGNGRGALAVVYTERRGAAGGRVWLAERRPGDRFGRPRVIARGEEIGEASVAVGQRGEILVAYARAGRLQTRLRRPRQRLDRAQDLGPAVGFGSLATAVTRGGRALVAVQRAVTGPGPGLPTRDTSVRISVRGPRAGRFGPPRLLDRARVPGGLAPRVLMATGADGSATIAWTNTAVESRRVGAEGRLSPPRRPGLDELGDLAARPDGTVVLVGLAGLVTLPGSTQNARPIVGVLGTPDGTVGTPELIALAPGGATTSVGINPRTGRPTVAWIGAGPAGGTALYTATRG